MSYAYKIYDIQPWLALVLAGAAFVAVNAIGLLLISPLRGLIVGNHPSTNDVVGAVLSFYSVLYGLLIGTLAVATYQSLSATQDITEHEAADLAALYRDVSSYPEPHRSELRTAITNYTRYIIDVDFPLQKKGIVNKGGIPLVDDIQRKIVSYEPATPGQQALHEETIRQFNNLTLQRRARLTSIDTGMPAVLWYTLIGGSILCLFLIWLFDASFRSIFLLSSVTAFSMGCMIGLIAIMDNPFRGQLAGGADSYIALYDILMKKAGS